METVENRVVNKDVDESDVVDGREEGVTEVVELEDECWDGEIVTKWVEEK